jgi:hypothetical protein
LDGGQDLKVVDFGGTFVAFSYQQLLTVADDSTKKYLLRNFYIFLCLIEKRYSAYSSDTLNE